MFGKEEGFFILTFLVLVLTLSFVSSLEISSKDVSTVVIAELDNPAIYQLEITNEAKQTDSLELISFVGIDFAPKGALSVPPGTSTVEIRAFPSSEVRDKFPGFYTFEYWAKSQVFGVSKHTLTLKIVPLAEAIEISAESIKPEDSSVIIGVSNLQNTKIESMLMRFESELFNETKEVSLEPFQVSNISIELTKENLRGLRAGYYPVIASLELEDARAEVRTEVLFEERSFVDIIKDFSGFIIRRNTIERNNLGNVDSIARIEVRKNILTRLFSTFSPEADEVVRNGVVVDYVWERELAPGESFFVRASTNYTLPFILVVLIVLIAFLVWVYTRTALIVQKRVSFVRTKGGEFALKVNLIVRAKKNVQSVEITDFIPRSARLYEKFGKQPDKVDAKTRGISWDVGHLSAGEERVFSYIIYSKLRILGRFELPRARASFMKKNKKGEMERDSVLSNRAYFVATTAEVSYYDEE